MTAAEVKLWNNNGSILTVINTVKIYQKKTACNFITSPISE